MLLKQIYLTHPVSASPVVDIELTTLLAITRIVFGLSLVLPRYSRNSLQDYVANLKQILSSMNVQELASARVAPKDVIAVFQGHVVRVSRLR